LTHTGLQEPETLEGRIVKIVDRVAYINHDIDDAIRYGILSAEQLPRVEIEVLGSRGSERIDRLVHDLVETSEGAGDIRQSDEVGEAMLALRAFMFEHVYLAPPARKEHARAHDAVRRIFEWLGERFNVPIEYDESSPQAELDRRRRERLFALLEQATAFYERYLWDSAAGDPVREYLASRGISEQTARAFRLGLAPLGSTLS